MLKNVGPRIRKLGSRILPQFLKGWIYARVIHPAEATSSDYKIVENDAAQERSRGWQNPTVGEKQYQAFQPLLDEMRNGRPREDFAALAFAVKKTGLMNPTIIEVGCGNGWNSEVISFLLNIPICYCGIDISPKMASLGRQIYPDREFLLGTATSLPIKDQSCDILLSGTVLMHLIGYREAIRERRRVSRHWCIFHTVPLMKKRETTRMEKKAYGQPTVEIIFNETEFIRILDENDFSITAVIDSIPYDLKEVIGERPFTKTFICEVKRI